MQDILTNIISYLVQIGNDQVYVLLGAHRREERPAEKEPDRRWAVRLSEGGG